MEINGIGSGTTASSTVGDVKAKAADDSFEKKLKAAMDTNDDKALRTACNEFEGVLLKMMFKEMRAAVPKSDLLPDDSGRDMYQSMLDEQLVDEATKSRNIGLGDVLYKQLSKTLKSAYKLE